ncbi:MAG: PRC-barrel domain-containing protein, partial [Phycisphaerales bacterium]|nr:PRC-barrel domain-containing protein [Phycisphaerales bacterium]
MRTLYFTPIAATLLLGCLTAQSTTAEAAKRLPARCKASQLIGLSITNSHDENLGEIQDIVMDGANRNIAYAVVGFGGVLGMGEKHFAMPWRLIEVTQRGAEQTPRATLGLDRAALKAAPGFDKGSWPDMADSTWAQQVDDYYRQRSETARPEGAAEPRGSAKDGSRGVDQPPGSKQFLHRRLSRLIGMNVVDVQHKKIADCEDFVIDTNNATIDGVLLSFGGVLGIGESLVLLPADALTLDPVKEVFVIACTRKDLESIALKDGKLPPLTNEAWLTSSREQVVKARKRLVPENGDLIPVDASGAKGVQYADHFDVKAKETIEGTITTVGTVRIGDGEEQRARWRVRTSEGREVIVYGAPASFADQENLGLRTGTKVKVTGSPAKYGSQTVLVAGTIEAGGKTATL